MDNKEKFKQLFLSTFQLSACTFGGGFVIIPLMRKKFVEDLHWIEEDEMMERGIVDDDLAIIGDELRQDAHVVAEMEKDDQEKGEGAEQVDFVDALFLSSRRFRKEHVLVPGWRVCHGVDYSTCRGGDGCKEKEKRKGLLYLTVLFLTLVLKSHQNEDLSLKTASLTQTGEGA